MAMRRIIEPLIDTARTGIYLKSADGHVRFCFPILGMYIADHPEQVLLTCIKSKHCPVCMAIYEDVQIGNGLLYQPRTSTTTLTLRDQYSSDYLWQKYGISSQIPFTNDWFLSDIYQSISPDLLHQIMKGMFKHIMDWVDEILANKPGWTKIAITREIDI